MRNIAFLGGVLLAGFLLASTTATADFGVTGEWYSNRGPTVNIPPGKFDGPCGGKTDPNIPFVTAVNATAGGVVTGIATPIPATQWVPGPCARHQKHGLPAYGVPDVALSVNVQSGVPAPPQIIGGVATSTPNGIGDTFVVPPGIFQRQLLSIVPVPANQQVQQLDTSFIQFGPATSRQLTNSSVRTSPGGATSVNPVSPSFAGFGQRAPIPTATRKMQTNAWAKVGQTPRMNKDFDWFQTTVAGGVDKRASYIAGPNAFGGTMSKLLADEGVVWVGPLDLVGQVPGNEMLASPIGDAWVPLSPRQPLLSLRPNAQGRGYLSTNRRTGMAGKIFANYNIPFTCTVQVPPTPIGCSLLTGVSVTLGYNPPKTPGGGYGGPLPTTTNIGFPMTTGHVSFYVKFLRAGIPQTTTLTAVGNDTTTPGGVRTVQLVGGGIQIRNTGTTGQSFGSQLDTVTISLPEPATTAMFAGAFALVGGLFAARRRLF
jgi:hypothetical protein